MRFGWYDRRVMSKGSAHALWRRGQTRFCKLRQFLGQGLPLAYWYLSVLIGAIASGLIGGLIDSSIAFIGARIFAPLVRYVFWLAPSCQPCRGRSPSALARPLLRVRQSGILSLINPVERTESFDRADWPPMLKDNNANESSMTRWLNTTI